MKDQYYRDEFAALPLGMQRKVRRFKIPVLDVDAPPPPPPPPDGLTAQSTLPNQFPFPVYDPVVDPSQVPSTAQATRATEAGEHGAQVAEQARKERQPWTREEPEFVVHAADDSPSAPAQELPDVDDPPPTEAGD